MTGDSRTPFIRVTAMPTDLNPYGGVFGGWLMSQMALGAGSLASREGKGKAVVVSATDFAFPGAMSVGDELSVYCAIEATGNTSLTISAEAIARDDGSEGDLGTDPLARLGSLDGTTGDIADVLAEIDASRS